MSSLSLRGRLSVSDYRGDDTIDDAKAVIEEFGGKTYMPIPLMVTAEEFFFHRNKFTKVLTKKLDLDDQGQASRMIVSEKAVASAQSIERKHNREPEAIPECATITDTPDIAGATCIVTIDAETETISVYVA